MILVIDDDMAVRASLSFLFKQNGFAFKGAEGPEQALQMIAEELPELIILDMNFSIDTSGKQGLALLREIRAIATSVPIILLTGWGSMELAIEGMKGGARDFLTKPWDNNHLLESIRSCLQISKSVVEDVTRKELNQNYHLDNIVGEHPTIINVLQTLSRISQTDASVLILGESGTGKELIAEAIHQNSLRQNNPFVKVNLGGISTSLFESEMFGHKKGAFTDAHTDRIGRFELANTGTIFLDEIGDLDKSAQVKLLRVLQEKSFEPLGSSQTKKVNIRVISATNKNLEKMVADGTFREDLYYRINLISLQLPSLRERNTDIPLLVNFFINNLKAIYNRPNLSVSKKALRWLGERPFPGNIRQLKNVVERTVLVSPKNELEISDFESQLINLQANSANSMPAVGTITIEEMEIQMIIKAMEFHQANISKVARSLGISRNALYRRLEKYDIPHDA